MSRQRRRTAEEQAHDDHLEAWDEYLQAHNVDGEDQTIRDNDDVWEVPSIFVS